MCTKCLFFEKCSKMLVGISKFDDEILIIAIKCV